MATSSAAVARLEYNAAREQLAGVIGQAPRFDLTAYSGSRGHKTNVSPQVATQNLHAQANSLMTRLATTKTREDNAGHYTQRGGTLPPGHYLCHYLHHHSTFGECIQLQRMSDAVAIHSPFASMPIPHGRGDDFFIHGSGPKGSDGCIVPANNGERLRLNKAVRDFPGRVILQVTHVSYMLPAEIGGMFA